MRKFFPFLMLSLLLLAGCRKYEVQYDGPYSDEDNTGVPPVSFEIAYVINGKICLRDRYLTQEKCLEGDFGNVQRVSINYDHDKMAYRSFGKDIVIIDMEGNELETVPNSANMDWFDWHKNGQTLYLLDGLELRFHGPAVPVPSTDLNGVFPAGVLGKEVNSIAVSPNGNLVFDYKFYTPDLTFYSRVAVWFRSAPSASYYLSFPATTKVNFMRLDEDGNQALFGLEYQGQHKVYRLSVLNGDNFILSNATQAAISPEGSAIAMWETPSFYLYQNSAFQFDTGNKTIFSMDW